MSAPMRMDAASGDHARRGRPSPQRISAVSPLQLRDGPEADAGALVAAVPGLANSGERGVDAVGADAQEGLLGTGRVGAGRPEDDGLGRLRRQAHRVGAAGGTMAQHATIRRLVIRPTEQDGSVKLLGGALDTADMGEFRRRIDAIAEEKAANPISTLAWIALRLRSDRGGDPTVAEALAYVERARDARTAELGEDVIELAQLSQFEALARDLEVRDELLPFLAARAREAADDFRAAIGRATARVGADAARSPIERLELMTDLCRAIIARIADESMAMLTQLGMEPKQPVAAMTGGSFSRKEVFPASDLDFGVLGAADERHEVMRLMLLMDAKVNIARQLLARDLGLSADKAPNVAFEPDNGPFLTAIPSPAQVAAKGVTNQNTGQDSTFLPTGIGSLAGQQDRYREFTDQRALLTNQRQTFGELTARVQEFVPPAEIRGRVDIKNPLIRLLTLSMRDLAVYFEVGGASTVERINALAVAGVLDGGLAAGLKDAFSVLVAMRAALHEEHQIEHDVAVTVDTPGEHTLTPDELRDLTRANMILAGYHDALRQLIAGDPGPLAGRPSARVEERRRERDAERAGTGGGFFNAIGKVFSWA